MVQSRASEAFEALRYGHFFVSPICPPSATFSAFGDFSRLRRFFPPSAVCAPKRAQSFNFAKLSKAKLSFAPKRAKLRANAQKRRA